MKFEHYQVGGGGGGPFEPKLYTSLLFPLISEVKEHHHTGYVYALKSTRFSKTSRLYDSPTDHTDSCWHYDVLANLWKCSMKYVVTPNTRLLGHLPQIHHISSELTPAFWTPYAHIHVLPKSHEVTTFVAC